MDRRAFITSTGMAAVAVGLTGTNALASPKQNKLPQWKGFNFLDFFSPDPESSRNGSTKDQFPWMQEWGFNVVRIPMADPPGLDVDRSQDLTPDDGYQITPQDAVLLGA